MKTKSSKFYYIFWLTSSRGTDEVLVRMYPERQKPENLKADVEAWASNFGAWNVSENMVNYGWREIRNLPKSRNECLAKHEEAWKRRNFWKDKVRLYAGLLAQPPFNGQK